MPEIKIKSEMLEEIISKYVVEMFDEVYEPSKAEGNTCVDLIMDELNSDYMDEKVLDTEDVNFLKDLIEELPKIDGDTYKSESEELENILFRLTGA